MNALIRKTFFILLASLALQNLNGDESPENELRSRIIRLAGNIQENHYKEVSYSDLGSYLQSAIRSDLNRFLLQPALIPESEMRIGLHYSTGSKDADSIQVKWIKDEIEYTVYSSSNISVLQIPIVSVTRMFIEGKSVKSIFRTSNSGIPSNEWSNNIDFDISEDQTYFTSNKNAKYPRLGHWSDLVEGFYDANYLTIVVYKIIPQRLGTRPITGWLQEMNELSKESERQEPRKWTQPKVFSPDK